MFETIVALATAPMKAALGVIRVSGDDALNIVSKCFTKDISNITKREIFVGEIIDDGEIVDQVVLLGYVAPRSYTGENMVEIICHGSVLIANEIIAVLIKNGAKLADRGEFSMRSFLNQKMDLVQAEAVNDVINATTKESKKVSMLSLEGDTSELLNPIKTKLADIISLIEVNIDYPEYEDIEVANKEMIIRYADEISSMVSKLIEDGEKGIIIKDGIKVSIVGKPNVGKSSLLNALMKQEKAIVTNIAGTTRDIVEGDVNINGITLHLLDTAGIRETDDVVESIGVNKAVETTKEADLVIVVIDGSKELDKDDLEILELTKDTKRIIVYNKADISNYKEDKINISALNKDITPLTDEIQKIIGISKEDFNKPSLNNARQLGLLKQCIKSLQNAKEDALNDLSVDLLAVSILDAYKAILAILGENTSLDISKEIFSRFCVGK